MCKTCGHLPGGEDGSQLTANFNAALLTFFQSSLDFQKINHLNIGF